MKIDPTYDIRPLVRAMITEAVRQATEYNDSDARDWLLDAHGGQIYMDVFDIHPDEIRRLLTQPRQPKRRKSRDRWKAYNQPRRVAALEAT
jgi:hypothetical protein